MKKTSVAPAPALKRPTHWPKSFNETKQDGRQDRRAHHVVQRPRAMDPPQTAARRLERSSFLTRSLYINGRKSNVGLEHGFWDALTEIAAAEGINVSRLISMIVGRRRRKNSSSTIRLFVLGYYRSRRNGDPKQTGYQIHGQSPTAPLR
jgi:predicted DNA-binding ribbon-helix-helix protein